MSKLQRPRPPYLHLDFLANLPELEDPRPLYVHRQSSFTCFPILQAAERNNEMIGPQKKHARADTYPSAPSQKYKPTSLSLDENRPPGTAQPTPQRKIRPLPPLPPSSSRTSSCPRPRPLPSPPLSAPPMLLASSPPVSRVSAGLVLSPPPRSGSLPTYKRQRFFIVSNPDPEPEPEPNVYPQPPQPQESSQQRVKLHLTIPTSIQRSLSIKISPVSTNPGSPLVFHVPDTSSPLTIDDHRSVEHNYSHNGEPNSDRLYGVAAVTGSDSSDHELTKLGDFEHTIYVETPIQLHGVSWNGEKKECNEDEDDSSVDDGTEHWELAEGMMVHVRRDSKLVTKKWVIEQGKKRWTQDDYGGIIEALRLL